MAKRLFGMNRLFSTKRQFSTRYFLRSNIPKIERDPKFNGYRENELYYELFFRESTRKTSVWILAGLLTGIAFQKSDKLDGCFPQAEEEDTQQHKLQPISTIPAGLLACGVVTVWRSWIKLVMQTTSTRRYFKFPPLPPAGIPRIMFMWAIVSSSFNTVVGIRYMARILRGQPVVRVASSRPTKTLVETK